MAQATEQFKPLSCGDMDGLLCLLRHLAERYLGMRVVGPEMEYGINIHNIAHVANSARMRDKDPDIKFLVPFIGAEGPAEFDALAKPWGVKGNEYTQIPLAMKPFAEMSLEWFLERTHGSQPIDAERLTAIEIGGYKWQFKPDCLRLSPDGVLIVDDYKTGYIPDREEVMHTPRVMIYALAASRHYQVDKVQTILWNVSQKFSVVIDWDLDELSRIEKYLAKDTARVVKMHELLKLTPEEHWPALMDDHEQFPCSINAWCRSCPVKSSCHLHGKLIGEGIFPQGATLTERVKQAKAAKAVVDKEEKVLKDSLMAEVLSNGNHIMVMNSEKELVPAMSLTLGDGLEAVFKSEERETKEISVPALERFVATHGEFKVDPDEGGITTLAHGRVDLTLKAGSDEYEELKREVEHATTRKLIIRREGPCTGKNPASKAGASVTTNTSGPSKPGSKGKPDGSAPATPAGKSVTLSAKVKVGATGMPGGSSQSDTISPAAPTPGTGATPATSATSAGPATKKTRGKSAGGKEAGIQEPKPGPASPAGPAVLTPDEFQAIYKAKTFPSREAAVAAASTVKVKGDTVEVFSSGGVHAVMLGSAYTVLQALLPKKAGAEKEEGK